MNFVKIMWSDDFSGQEMAILLRDKFDITVSYFMEDYDFGVRIKEHDFNSKILNFIKKKVDVISNVVEESKKSSRKSMKESKSDLLADIQNLISSSGFLNSIADVEDTLEIAYMIAERLDPSDYGFKDEDALANKINFELKYDREYAKLFESKKSIRKSIEEEYDPTDDIVNKGNSVSMNYKQFIDFIDSQGYKLNITDATIFLGSSHGDFEVHGNEMQVIPSENKLIVNDNHSDIEFSTKNISEVRSVSLKSNILRADFITKQGSVLTVWWEL